MGIKQIVESKGYKNFMAKLYGIGAAVVILGALFKIMHYPGAGLMLLLGMGTEAVIFFLSSFEPMHVEPDWSLVYPELWGLYHPDEAESGLEAAAPVRSGVGGKTLTQELDNMLADAKIGPELIASLGDGMRNLSENASKMSGVADAAAATDGFVTNLGKASESVASLNSVYAQTSEVTGRVLGVTEEFANTMKNTTENAGKVSQAFMAQSNVINSDVAVNEEYLHAVQSAVTAAKNMATQYASSSESLAKSAEAINFNMVDGKSYGDQIQKITSNLSALNSIYEIQVQSLKTQSEKIKEFEGGVSTFSDNVAEMVNVINAYKEQANALNRNMSTLNTVYGNMLAAMNVNQNR